MNDKQVKSGRGRITRTQARIMTVIVLILGMPLNASPHPSWNLPDAPLAVNTEGGSIATQGASLHADAGGPYNGVEGSLVILDASNSSGSSEQPMEYRWDFNNDSIWDTNWTSSPYAEKTWYDDYSGQVALQVRSLGQERICVSNEQPAVAFSGIGASQQLAEAFVPNASLITKISVNVATDNPYPPPDDDLRISLRSSLDGPDLAYYEVPNTELPVHTPFWIDLDIADTEVEPDSTYYIHYESHPTGINSVYVSWASWDSPDGTFYWKRVPDDWKFDVALDNLFRVWTRDLEHATDYAEVIIANAAPSIISYAEPTGEEGDRVFFEAIIHDPGADLLTVTWDFGFCDLEVQSYPPGERSTWANSSAMHIYGDDFDYGVTLTVSDDDGAESTVQFNATVSNLPPSIGVMLPDAAYEGASSSFNLLSIDPGSDDLKITWSWGDGSTDETLMHFNDGANPDPRPSPKGMFPFEATEDRNHTYGDDGAYQLSISVQDDDGGSTSWSGQVIVANLPPTIQPISPFTADEGGLFSISTNATDPGSDDLTFEWSLELGPTFTNVYYNNGVSPDSLQSPGGEYPFSATDTIAYTYGDNAVYILKLTVKDDDGGSATYVTTISVKNLPPVIRPFGPFEVNEADPLSITASAVDPGSDDLSFTWTFEFGPTIHHTTFNDATGPDPSKSPDGVFPFSMDDIVAYTYGDNGVFKIALTVEDDDGGSTMYETIVTVLNLPPTILHVEAFMLANITLRVAGEKWHDVVLRLYEDGNETGYARVVKYPGSPDDQSVALHNVKIGLTRSFSAVAYYSPTDDPINGQPNGANPAWINFNWENGNETRLHHIFNVKHNDTWIWRVENINLYAVNQIIHFNAVATDKGSDDLTFKWAFGDGRTHTSVTYNSGVSSDPYPSPEVNPLLASSEVVLSYCAADIYRIALMVLDDDGGSVIRSFDLALG